MEFQPDYSVVLIPDHLVTEKQSTIVVYLQDDIPPSVRNVTVELRHKTSGKLEFLVAVKLGPDALLLRVPEIKQAGELEGTIKLDGKTSPRYPPFLLPVLTPLDTLFHNSIRKGKRGGEVRNSKAVLAGAVAYLTTLKPRESEKEANADLLLEHLFRIQGARGKKVPVMVKDICAGKQTCDESLLHFTLRHGLVRLVDYLLEGESPVNKRQLISSLGQESFDCLTAQFLAKSNYPDILPKLDQMYKDEIGSQIKRRTSQLPHDSGRRHSRIAEIMTLVSLRRRRSSAAKSAAVSRRPVSGVFDGPVSGVFDGRKRSTSWNDISSHLADTNPQGMLAQLQQNHTGRERTTQSVSALSDSDDDFEEYIPMYPSAERRRADNPLVRQRKISLSVDAGLDRLLSNRPLPDIPSGDSDVDESESIYEEPRPDIMDAAKLMDGNVNETSAVVPSNAIYDIPPPGVRPAAEEHHGTFKTKTQLKAWSQSELRAEPSADKDSGSEEEQDLKLPTVREDKLERSATDDYKEQETHVVVQFSQHEHN